MEWLKRHALWIALGALLVALLAWAVLPAAVPVETALAEKGALEVTIDEDGEVRAHDRYVVAAPIAGKLARMTLEEGDEVQAGLVVARIEASPLSVREREELAGRVAAAQALVKEAEQRVAHAQADFEQTRRERVRSEQLAAKGFLPSQAAEQARNSETTQRNELDAARYRLQSAQADLRAARAPLAVSEGGAVLAVHAPATGRVLRIVDKSERVVAAGTPLLTLGDPSRLEVVIDVLSTDAVKIAPGMPVLLDHWGGAGVLHGRVRRVDPAAFTKVSALGVEEQRVNVVVDFTSPPGTLGDGYRVEGHVVIAARADVLKVPSTCLFRNGDGWSVYVVEGGRARLRRVTVGLRSAQDAEIVAGLAAGNRVVRHPSNPLSDGVRVKVL
ncbi:MAG: efflux RND transporter periplasmic adaptor subunit [Betaproteobacteria bacterium]|nr:efflux RND transporter periplasmic adaptor subunit [Betaproteobacteria bacterium]MDE1982345.1 efflux RND transporter periplasmic adaptor subunit [Betaproteobacteria bacterium]MDE2132118.1 efflux RND transporter periplasmic adaptor subunit [Betaproteobacteria bacterium]MDE2212134.1 efflux RND transporter periplasmic adaptor subunit [Betaproteobacteria bacterium]